MKGKDSKKLKGQFFILGALLIVALFFSGLPKPPSIILPNTGELEFLYDNLQKNYPIVLNMGINLSLIHI